MVDLCIAWLCVCRCVHACNVDVFDIFRVQRKRLLTANGGYISYMHRVFCIARTLWHTLHTEGVRFKDSACQFFCFPLCRFHVVAGLSRTAVAVHRVLHCQAVGGEGYGEGQLKAIKGRRLRLIYSFF